MMPPDPRAVIWANVVCDGTVAATLTRTDSGVEFRYRTEYLSSGQAALLVTRFDREISPHHGLLRLAVEDAAQLLGIYPADKYNVSSEDVANAIGQVCAARAVQSATDHVLAATAPVGARSQRVPSRVIHSADETWCGRSAAEGGPCCPRAGQHQVG